MTLLVRPVGMPTVALALAVVATAGAVASALLVGYQADRGAHGRFDRRARHWSPALELSLHRGWIAAASIGLVAAIIRSSRRTGAA